jgi:hypothetical protein
MADIEEQQQNNVDYDIYDNENTDMSDDVGDDIDDGNDVGDNVGDNVCDDVGDEVDDDVVNDTLNNVVKDAVNEYDYDDKNDNNDTWMDEYLSEKKKTVDGIDEVLLKTALKQLLELNADNLAARKKQESKFLPSTTRFLNLSMAQKIEQISPSITRNLLYLCHNIIMHSIIQCVFTYDLFNVVVTCLFSSV